MVVCLVHEAVSDECMDPSLIYILLREDEILLEIFWCEFWNEIGKGKVNEWRTVVAEGYECTSYSNYNRKWVARAGFAISDCRGGIDGLVFILSMLRMLRMFILMFAFGMLLALCPLGTTC